jgi:hypothetical protein
MTQTFSCILSGPKQPKELACSHRISTDLPPLIYKGKHVQIENKYFW